MKNSFNGNRLLPAKLPFGMIIPVFLFFLYLILHFNGLYGQDSFEYLRYSRALHDFFNSGNNPGTFYWPLLYPLSGALLSYVLPDILSLQLLNLMCFGLTILFLQKILQQLHPGNTMEINCYIFLFFSLSPFVMRYSSTIMSDAMAMLMITGFCYFYLRYGLTQNNRYFMLMALAGFCALNTRYAAFLVVVIPGLLAVTVFIRNFSLKNLLYSLLIGLVVFLPNIYFSFLNSHSLFGSIPWPEWSFINFFRRSFVTENGNLAYTLPNILYTWSSLVHPGFIFCGIIFIFLLRKNAFQAPVIRIFTMIIFAYALFLAGLATQNLRFLLLTFPLILVLFYPSFHFFYDRLVKARPITVYLAVFIVMTFQLALFYRAFRPFYENSRDTRYIAERMGNYPGKVIYTFNIDMALKAYHVNNQVVNLWAEKVGHFKPESLVLFNETGFSEQWKGYNPMINWETMKREYKLDLIEKMPGGWNLYEISE